MEFSPQDRFRHQREVYAFLRKELADTRFEFTCPHGWGHETYFARGGGNAWFVKLGVELERYRVMSSLGLTPAVEVAGTLPDGTSIVVQPLIAGRNPSRLDFRTHLNDFAGTIRTFHQSRELRDVLPEPASSHFRDAGLLAFNQIEQRWRQVRDLVPGVADFVDQSLAHLSRQIRRFEGAGLVASHNDICNANWLLSADGRLYLIDLEAMSIDDPAADLGAILWWYYPPSLRPGFLELAGKNADPAFQHRMRVRMALHCLHITLPRKNSFDRFNPQSYAQSLADFRALMAGEENPQGYDL